MISLTEKAAQHIRNLSKEQEVGHLTIRFGVKGGGCEGFKYDIYFDDIGPRGNDTILKFEDITVFIDPISLQYVEGTEIDHIKTLMRNDFVFNNPNVSSSCGCSKSISFKM